MPQTENLTILFTDMVNYTERTSKQSRAQNRALLQRQNRVLLPLVTRFGGRPVKSIGDALLSVFRSPTDAVRCGMAMLDALAEANGSLPPAEQIHIRVAINLGEVAIDRGDVFGEAVNVASRVEGVTPAGEIWFTEAVYLAMNKAEVPCKLVGVQQLKGVPEPVRVYCVPPRHINRLTPAAEGLPPAPGQLPFGGMHRLEAPRGLHLKWLVAYAQMQWRSLHTTQPSAGAPTGRKRSLAAGVIVGAAVAVLIFSWLRPAPPETDGAAKPVAVAEKPPAPAEPEYAEFLREAEVLLRGEQLREAQALYAQRLEAKSNDPAAVLVRGHVLYALGRNEAQGFYKSTESALASYAQALRAEPALKDDARLVANLVSALGRVTAAAKPLLVQYSSPRTVDALARRSGESGVYGRNAAAQVLKQMGHPERIDAAGFNLWELQERGSCAERRAAAIELARVGDARALAPLRASIDGFVKRWFENGCLKDEAQAAIAAIQARDSRPPP